MGLKLKDTHVESRTPDVGHYEEFGRDDDWQNTKGLKTLKIKGIIFLVAVLTNIHRHEDQWRTSLD